MDELFVLMRRLCNWILMLELVAQHPAQARKAGADQIANQIRREIRKNIKVDVKSPTEIEKKYWLKKNENEIKKILYAYGMFDAAVSPIDNSITNYHIEFNERYKLQGVKCKYQGARDLPLATKELFQLLELQQDHFVTSKQLANGARKLKDYFCHKGYAFAFCDRPEIEIDRTSKTMSVTYPIRLGPRVEIDRTIVQIKSRRDGKRLEPFVRNRLPWKAGDIYSLKLVDEFKDAMTKCDMFAGADVQLVNLRFSSDQATAKADILITLDEALLRSIEGSVELSTTEYFAISLGWMHRNLDGRGAQLSVSGNVTSSARDVRIKHSLFDMFFPKQQLASQAYTVYENNDSYDLKSFGIESIIWHPINRVCEVGFGGALESFNVDDHIEPDWNKTYGANFQRSWGLPVGLKLNLLDNVLEPRRGTQIRCDFLPNFGAGNNYQTLVLKLTQYISFSAENWYARNSMSQVYIKLGTILNGDGRSIPRHKWFFAGGADSVRGYGTKKVSSLTAEGNPIGGKKLFEFGIEHTVKVRPNIGLSVFFEGGKVAQKSLTDKEDVMLYSWGIGARYYTMLGIIRLDFAFPFKRRETKDGKKVDRFGQVYMRVG